MKKFLSVLLAAALALSLGVTAMAATNSGPTETTFEKIFTLTRAGSTSPKATFKFKYTSSYQPFFGSVDSTVTPPAITIGEVHFDAGAVDKLGTTEGVNTSYAQNVTVSLPSTYDRAGIYTYAITEDTTDAVAGVAYDDKVLNLHVFVTHQVDSDTGKIIPDAFEKTIKYTYGTDTTNKIEDPNFENKFPANNLTIKKEVTGTYADANEYFEVAVTLTPTASVGNPISLVGSTYDGGSENKVLSAIGTTVTTLNFHIKHGETITIQGIPAGVGISIKETDTDTDHYSATYSVTSGDGLTVSTDRKSVEGAMKEEPAAVLITNEVTATPPTGITLDSLPYIVLLGGAAVGLFLVILGKRKREEED